MKTAIIGGSGVYDPAMLSNVVKTTVNTIFGEVTVSEGQLDGRDIVFLARHGSGHTVAPHRINYRANIAALKVLGVERIIATAAVGSLNGSMPPGSFVVPDQFIDNTWGRPVQFFDDGEWAVTHLDMSAPYCTQMREFLIASCDKATVSFSRTGTYVCFQGPRYETPAEIKMYSMLGGDIAGMTHVPEIVLAREAEICYSGICVVTNWGAGMSGQNLKHSEVSEMMSEVNESLKGIITSTIKMLPDARSCGCGKALDEMVAWGRRRPDFRAR